MSFFCVRNKCIYACTLHIDICTQKSTNIKNCHIYSRIKILWPSFVVCIDTKCICIFKNLLIINNNNCCVYTHVNTHICKQSQEANSRCCFSGTTHLEFLDGVSMAWNWASRLGSWPGSPREPVSSSAWNYKHLSFFHVGAEIKFTFSCLLFKRLPIRLFPVPFVFWKLRKKPVHP